jgi:hypothetical protein
MADQVDCEYHLKKLGHNHADFQRSEALATNQKDLADRYWYKPSTLGAIFSIGLATAASYWGFSLAATILTYLNADISKFTLVVCLSSD